MNASYTAEFTAANMRWIRSAVTRWVSNPSDVEDLVQDTMLRAWLARDRYDGSVRWSTWLWQIAKNATFDHLRKLRRVAENVIDGIDLDTLRAPEHERVELREIIDQGMAALSPKIRETMIVVCLEGCTDSEAGERINAYKATIRTRVRLGREGFKRATEWD